LMDLYSIFSFLQPGLFGVKRDFRRDFELVVKRGFKADSLGTDLETMALNRAKMLGRKIDPYTIYKYKDTSQHFSFDLDCEMPAEQIDEYESVTGLHTRVFKKRKKIPLPGGGSVVQETHTNEASRLKALKQIAEARGVLAGNNVAKTHIDSFVDDHLDDLLQLGPTAFFFNRLNQMDTMKSLLDSKGISYVEIRGSTSPSDRQVAIAAHNAGKAKVFLGSETACATGISLYTLASIVICSPNWCPANTLQISARGSRPQNKNKIVVLNLFVSDTIEDAIVRTNRLKRRIIDAVFGAKGPDAAQTAQIADKTRDMLRYKRKLTTY